MRSIGHCSGRNSVDRRPRSRAGRGGTCCRPGAARRVPAVDLANGTDDLLWHQDAIIYTLHVKTFFDANGDGVGDFAGLIEKLDYLVSLGVTCVWLLPFYASPLRHDGYDIADFERIDPRLARWTTSRDSSLKRTAVASGSLRSS